MSFPPPARPAAGWYPDPSGQPTLRWYDGNDWTPHTATTTAHTPDHPTLSLSVMIGAVAILAVSLIASRPLLDLLIERDWPVPVLMVVSAFVGYVPPVLWLWYACRRWGTGRPLADLGVSFRWSDLGWGPLVWVATLLAMGATLMAVRALDIPYRGNLDLTVASMVERNAIVSLVVSAVVLAPVVEESIFRGAVLRGLLSKLPAPAAVTAQGVLFGAAHFNPDFGRDNIGLMIVLSAAGASFGAAAFLLRRVGPTIIAHAILNGVAIVVALNDSTPS